MNPTISIKKLLLLSFAMFSINLANAQDIDIYEASRKGDLASLKEIYQKDPSQINQANAQDYTPLILAAYYDRVEIIQFLLDKDVELNDKNGSSTALQAACYKGFNKVVKLLLEYGANPNVYDGNGTSPLIYATQFKHNEIVKLLLDHGANKGYKDPTGNSAVDYAKKLEINELVDIFKK